MNILDKITSLREQRSWSISKLAYEAELNVGTVSNWFKRKSTPTLECLDSISYAFGITISELLNDNNEIAYLSDVQKEFLKEFDLLDPREKEDIIRLMRTRNETNKTNYSLKNNSSV